MVCESDFELSLCSEVDTHRVAAPHRCKPPGTVPSQRGEDFPRCGHDAFYHTTEVCLGLRHELKRCNFSSDEHNQIKYLNIYLNVEYKY